MPPPGGVLWVPECSLHQQPSLVWYEVSPFVPFSVSILHLPEDLTLIQLRNPPQGGGHPHPSAQAIKPIRFSAEAHLAASDSQILLMWCESSPVIILHLAITCQSPHPQQTPPPNTTKNWLTVHTPPPGNTPQSPQKQAIIRPKPNRDSWRHPTWHLIHVARGSSKGGWVEDGQSVGSSFFFFFPLMGFRLPWVRKMWKWRLRPLGDRCDFGGVFAEWRWWLGGGSELSRPNSPSAPFNFPPGVWCWRLLGVREALEGVGGWRLLKGSGDGEEWGWPRRGRW